MDRARYPVMVDINMTRSHVIPLFTASLPLQNSSIYLVPPAHTCTDFHTLLSLHHSNIEVFSQPGSYIPLLQPHSPSVENHICSCPSNRNEILTTLNLTGNQLDMRYIIGASNQGLLAATDWLRKLRVRDRRGRRLFGTVRRVWMRVVVS